MYLLDGIPSKMVQESLLPIRKRYTILVVQIGMIKVHGQIRIEELLLYTHSGEKVKVRL